MHFIEEISSEANIRKPRRRQSNAIKVYLLTESRLVKFNRLCLNKILPMQTHLFCI
jgi:hypothetical protein